jgi:hypothetical protein
MLGVPVNYVVQIEVPIGLVWSHGRRHGSAPPRKAESGAGVWGGKTKYVKILSTSIRTATRSSFTGRMHCVAACKARCMFLLSTTGTLQFQARPKHVHQCRSDLLWGSRVSAIRRPVNTASCVGAHIRIIQVEPRIVTPLAVVGRKSRRPGFVVQGTVLPDRCGLIVQNVCVDELAGLEGPVMSG